MRTIDLKHSRQTSRNCSRCQSCFCLSLIKKWLGLCISVELLENWLRRWKFMVWTQIKIRAPTWLQLRSTWLNHTWLDSSLGSVKITKKKLRISSKLSIGCSQFVNKAGQLTWLLKNWSKSQTNFINTSKTAFLIFFSLWTCMRVNVWADKKPPLRSK